VLNNKVLQFISLPVFVVVKSQNFDHSSY